MLFDPVTSKDIFRDYRQDYRIELYNLRSRMLFAAETLGYAQKDDQSEAQFLSSLAPDVFKEVLHKARHETLAALLGEPVPSTSRFLSIPHKIRSLPARYLSRRSPEFIQDHGKRRTFVREMRADKKRMARLVRLARAVNKASTADNFMKAFDAISIELGRKAEFFSAQAKPEQGKEPVLPPAGKVKTEKRGMEALLPEEKWFKKFGYRDFSDFLARLPQGRTPLRRDPLVPTAG